MDNRIGDMQLARNNRHCHNMHGHCDRQCSRYVHHAYRPSPTIHRLYRIILRMYPEWDNCCLNMHRDIHSRRIWSEKRDNHIQLSWRQQSCCQQRKLPTGNGGTFDSSVDWGRRTVLRIANKLLDHCSSSHSWLRSLHRLSRTIQEEKEQLSQHSSDCTSSTTSIVATATRTVNIPRPRTRGHCSKLNQLKHILAAGRLDQTQSSAYDKQQRANYETEGCWKSEHRSDDHEDRTILTSPSLDEFIRKTPKAATATLATSKGIQIQVNPPKPDIPQGA